VWFKRHRAIGLLSFSKRIFLSRVIFTAVCCDRFFYGIQAKTRLYGEDTEKGKADEHMVVYNNPWDMDSASGLYLAEIRDFYVT
jgi:hypothetical protein